MSDPGKESKKLKQGTTKRRVRVPLVVKMIGIISAIVVVATVTVTGLSVLFFTDDSRARAEDNALTVSQVVAAQMESQITSVYSGALSLFDVLRENGGNASLSRVTISDYLVQKSVGRLHQRPWRKGHRRMRSSSSPTSSSSRSSSRISTRRRT